MITNQISETSKPVCSSVLEMFLVGFFCVNWRRPGTSVCNVLAHWSLRTGALTLHIFLRETGQHNLLSQQTHFVREQILKVNNWENQFHISHSISQFADLLGVRRICTNVQSGAGGRGPWLGWLGFWCSIVWRILIGLMGIGQKWLCSWAGWWNIQIQVNPTKVRYH